LDGHPVAGGSGKQVTDCRYLLEAGAQGVVFGNQGEVGAVIRIVRVLSRAGLWESFFLARRIDDGRVAVRRRPLVYCLEQQDQTGAVADLVMSKTGDKFTEEFRSDLPGGLLMLKHAGAIY
jgi:hypothetical protein